MTIFSSPNERLNQAPSSDPGRSRGLVRRRTRLRLGPAIVWADGRMRRALAMRDIGMVYRLLNQAGVSQRRIAMCTDQSQSEILGDPERTTRRPLTTSLSASATGWAPDGRGWDSRLTSRQRI